MNQIGKGKMSKLENWNKSEKDRMAKKGLWEHTVMKNQGKK